MNLEQIKEKARKRSEDVLEAERRLIAELKADTEIFTEQDKSGILAAYAAAGYRDGKVSIEQMMEDIAVMRFDEKARMEIVDDTAEGADKEYVTYLSRMSVPEDGGEMFPQEHDAMSSGAELFEMENA